MKGLIARVHPMQKDCRYPDIIDLFSRDAKGNEFLCETIHVDTLSDLGVSDEAVAAIKTGKEVKVFCFADYEIPKKTSETEKPGHANRT